MTTIAYRAGVLAADTLLTCGQSHRDGFALKVFKFGDLLAAWGGNAVLGQRFMDWLKGGAMGEPPDLSSDKDVEIMIIMPDDLIITATKWGWDRSRSPYRAMGMGKDYASGAMAFGASAEEAVRAALVHECFSGGPITVLRR